MEGLLRSISRSYYDCKGKIYPDDESRTGLKLGMHYIICSFTEKKHPLTEVKCQSSNAGPLLIGGQRGCNWGLVFNWSID
jgi:hypothetical protein